eukprot:747934-Rhodomonas_salina.1
MPSLNSRSFTTNHAMKSRTAGCVQMCVLFALAQAASSHVANSQQSAFVQTSLASPQLSHSLRASTSQRLPLTLRTATPVTAVSSLSMSEDSTFARRDMMKRVLLAVSGSQLLSASANAQPAAGLDVNKGGGGFEKVDPSQLPKDKPKSKKRAAGMAIFEDEVHPPFHTPGVFLIMAILVHTSGKRAIRCTENLALGPSRIRIRGASQLQRPELQRRERRTGDWSQIIAFFDSETGDINTRITLVAQPAPVDSLDELKKSFVPNGEISKQGMEMKSVGKEDGAGESASARVVRVRARMGEG